MNFLGLVFSQKLECVACNLLAMGAVAILSTTVKMGRKFCHFHLAFQSLGALCFWRHGLRQQPLLFATVGFL
jgi:hypothetical protein